MSLNFAARRFECKPHFKLASLATPLSMTSAHNFAVNLSWPVQYIRSLRPLCTYLDDFWNAKRYVTQKFVDAGAHPQFCQMLMDVEPRPPQRRIDPTRSNTIWLALPYHPCYYRELSKCVVSFNRWPHLKALWHSAFKSTAPNIRIAWARGGPNLKMLLRWRLEVRRRRME